MEDRYLFKAKRVDNGKWIIGLYVNCCYPNKENETGHFILEYPNKYHEIYTNTLCQCTGLEDKNVNLIWENDIVNLKIGKAIVIWDKAEWRIKLIKDTICRKDLHFWINEDDWKGEVIGNIFDNPELLEV